MPYYNTALHWSIFDPNVNLNFIQHYFYDLESHFEALVPQNAYLASVHKKQ
jgi:hypothetical protein